ncbi:MAG TPA: DUF1501 domain-containing protein [Bryobacteraceae bacterium]|nr:DUF1501 domain-containing protein [Bryobacteraceae bacterium]
MNPIDEKIMVETRRQLLARGARGLGSLALYSLLQQNATAATEKKAVGGLPGLPQFPAKAKRAIYLHMLGAPPQMETFDYKPGMEKWFDKDLPDSIRQGQRLTAMTSGQARFPVAPSIFKFAQHGESGMWVSELLPYTAKMADDIAVVRSMNTDAINHDPAVTFMQTGFMIAGKPCVGSWISYGLGSMNQDLPTFVVLNASHSNPKANVQAISARLWSSGFLPGQYSGVALRSGGDPVLYISNPDGVSSEIRRNMLDATDEMNRIEMARLADPEIQVRIAQYEMAFRMQSSVPELTDISKEPESTFKLYGEDARKPGTFANCCLMARRLAERDVRFVQVYHRGWDVHSMLPEVLPSQCKDIDQGAYGLVQDLKSKGLLDDTLVVWGGEFGRTVYCQGKLTATDYGRDHHPKCFSIWMAGAGIKGGTVHGETDEFSYNIVKDPVHIRDLNATILNRFGIEDTRFTFKYQGLDQKLTGTEKRAVVVKDILV